ncbi:hypothetical protein D7030_06795 [Flavobacteriaceae bacterium AU392]|nr:hypothetical protein D1817_01625 [Flavobacteriaceae bacterium]RKM84836.1 hypothetical protein D7030_06795 [Flavobacteriaceae bacterium AU392]
MHITLKILILVLILMTIPVILRTGKSIKKRYGKSDSKFMNTILSVFSKKNRLIHTVIIVMAAIILIVLILIDTMLISFH